MAKRPLRITHVLDAITRAHVLAAIKKIDGEGTVPKRRNSTKYSVSAQRRLYPPKYLLCVAGEIATGQRLIPEEHSGGDQSNGRLRALGFKIVRQTSTFPEL